MRKFTQKGSVSQLLLTLAVLVILAGIIYLLTGKIVTVKKGSSNNNDLVSKKEVAKLTPSRVANLTIPDFLEINGKNSTLTLVNGRVEGVFGNSKGVDGKDSTISYWVELLNSTTSYAVGDVNGDGADDLVATLTASTGGTGRFFYLAVFASDNGILKYVTAEEIGDRIGLNQVQIEKGIITAKIITQGPGDGMCCATLPATVSYELVGNTLKKVANPDEVTATKINQFDYQATRPSII